MQIALSLVRILSHGIFMIPVLIPLHWVTGFREGFYGHRGFGRKPLPRT